MAAKYNIDDFLTLQARVFLTDPIHTNDNNAVNMFPVVTSDHNEDQTTTFQLDLMWKF